MPPHGFTAIKDATVNKSIVSLIGVIVSIQYPRKSNGTDFVLEFTIQDDFTSGVIGQESSMKCRLFRPKLDQFPKINGVGDVALLRNFKLNEWNFRMDACWTVNCGVLVFPASGIPIPALSEPFQTLGGQELPSSCVFGTRAATVAEQMEVIHVKAAASSLLPQVKEYAASAPPPPTVRDKRSLIKDLEFDKFYDVRAEVINTYWKDDGTVELKVTDYTSNESLYLYVDADDEFYSVQQDKLWIGPYGKLTMNVILYESNASWARENVTAGAFVTLRNMRTKMSPMNFLEGVLHQDRFRPTQVDIRKLFPGPELRELQKRKEEYEQECAKRHAQKSALDNLQNEPKKSSAKASASKKAEKKAKKRAQKEQEQKEIQEQAEKWDAARSGVNNNINAAHPDIQPSTLSEIIHNPHLHSRTPKYNDFTFPFLNVKHRSRVRVVDFFPPELEHFAHCTSDPQWEKRAWKTDPTDNNGKSRWEWGFVLLLEDAKVPPNTVSEKLRVVVGNDAAQYLLDMNARDLKRDEITLKQLEEKLFILWGNLLELKSEQRDRGSDMPLPPGDNRLQNKIFDCLIEEYGFEVAVSEKHPEGFQRMHRLAQTKIMSIL